MLGSDNQNPKVIYAGQGSTPSTPGAGLYKTFVRSSDGHLCIVDSAAVVTDVTPVVMRVTVTLTNAQIKALPSTPVALVADPGTGKWNHVFSASYKFNTTSAYTNINADSSLRIEPDSSGTYLVHPIVNDSAPGLTRLSDVLSATGSQFLHAAEYSEGALAGSGVNWNIPTPFGALSDYEGPTVLLIDNNGSGNLTGGNAANSLKVTVYYAVEDL